MDASELQRIHGEIRAAYWERKDLDEVVRLAREAIDGGSQSSDDKVLGWTKAIAYDLASFTWPGWDEPGIVIEPDHLKTGMEAARANLDLAVRLQRSADKVGMAHWMIGAHHLAAGDLDAACASFLDAERLAEQASDAPGAALARGYAALASRDAPGFARATRELAAMEDGEGYVEQLETAARVFG